MRPNIYHSESQSREYNDEIINYYLNNLYKKEPLDTTEVLYILNPEENEPEIDKYTKIRIENSKLFA